METVDHFHADGPPGHEKILFFPKAMDMDMDSESSDVQARPHKHDKQCVKQLFTNTEK